MSKKYQTAVVIGRFQPVHNAHLELIRRAGELAEQVVIIIGSAHQPRTFKNPWSAAERAGMIQTILHSVVDRNTMVRIESCRDRMYNDNAWAANIQSLVDKHTATQTQVAIVGHNKDETSYYLKMFPQWALEDIPLIEPLNASNIRDLYITENFNPNFIKGVVPDATLKTLMGFANTEDYKQLIRERDFIKKHNIPYASLPYPPVFVTVDACIIQSGHILMIRRRSEPGKGLWAMPGGYLNANSDASIEDAMIRELREETGIKVPEPVLRGNIKSVRVFAGINRSARGRLITHCHKIVLPDGELPRVKGMDDAEKAKWVPISRIDSEVCFEDHYEIIQEML